MKLFSFSSEPIVQAFGWMLLHAVWQGFAIAHTDSCCRAGGQQRVASVLRFLSPAILAHDALADLSGTGAARHRWFVAQVTRFHEGWRAFFSARIAGHQPLADYSQVPTFHFQEEPVGQPLRRAALGVGGVLLLTAIAFATARLAARRGGPLVSRAD